MDRASSKLKQTRPAIGDHSSNVRKMASPARQGDPALGFDALRTIARILARQAAVEMVSARSHSAAARKEITDDE